MPEYDDETAQSADELSSVATADTDESVEAAPVETASEDDDDFDPVQELRQTTT